MWPETHSKSTAVESYSVELVLKNTSEVPATVLNVEYKSAVLLIKKVIFSCYSSEKREYDTNFIPQVSEISFHSSLCVIIHLMAVIGLESYARWINI